MQYECRQLSLLSRPCNDVAALASGQVRAGACEDGVQMCVERVCKCIGLGKKKRKKRKKKRERKKKKKNADSL